MFMNGQLGNGQLKNTVEQSRRDFLHMLAGAGAALALRGPLGAMAAETQDAVGSPPFQPLETVRTAIIGLGARGSGHLNQMLTLEGVEITALCDNYEKSLSRAVERVKKAGRKEPAAFGRGDEDYKRMLERDDIDIVIIATPWEWHTRMCVDTMTAGKHAFTEVPAAVTLDECWQLVDTAEKTKKRCMMMENCCYGREELFCLNLCRQGLLGELLHGEAAYLHDLRDQMKDLPHGTGSWRTWQYAKRNGNLYPTHGLGPVAQYMGINRGDRFDYLSSVSSPAVGRAAYAKSHFPADHQWNEIEKWNCGDICTTIIKTALGRSIMVQWDETSPRPYSRINLIEGSRGTFAGYPSRLALEGVTPNTHEWVQGAKLQEYFTKYEHPLWAKMGELAAKAGGHGGMDWLMAWRMVDCLHRGEPLDQDVYDAAAWSSVGPLSEKSIANRSQSIDVPDFTRGRWKVTEPLGIVS
jgi:predicted dehydrogenase